MKKYILVMLAALVSFTACAQKKSGQPALNEQKAENPDFVKIDEILSRMSPRAQEEIVISDKNEFLSDLYNVLSEEK